MAAWGRASLDRPSSEAAAASRTRRFVWLLVVSMAIVVALAYQARLMLMSTLSFSNQNTSASFQYRMDHPQSPPHQQELHEIRNEPTTNNNNKNLLHKNQTQNSTLVIIIGNLRGGEQAWQTLYDNVLNVHHADLALLIGETKNKTSSLFQRAKYYWPVPEYPNWLDAMNLIFTNQGHDATTLSSPSSINTTTINTTWQASFFAHVHPASVLLGGVTYPGPFLRVPNNNNNTRMHSFAGSAAIIFLFRYFLTRRIQQLDLTRRYQTFIITRSDHYYLCPSPLRHFDPNKLYVPAGEDYTGYTDRYLMVSNQLVLRALNVYPWALSSWLSPAAYTIETTSSSTTSRQQQQRGQHYTPKNTRQWWSSPGILNPERLLKRTWHQQGLEVQRMPRTMFTCAAAADGSRWKQPEWEAGLTREGVYLKYPAEYTAAHETCAQWTNKE